MANPAQPDTLGTMGTSANTSWDWKTEYVSSLESNRDGLERFSQLSATPDTTAVFAGPARYRALGAGNGVASKLTPIGLVDGIAYNQSAQLQRLYEIGSNRSFFTRGKVGGSLQMSKMIANQNNLVAALLKNAMPNGLNLNGAGTRAPGTTIPGNDDAMIALNLDSELTNIPFGVMLVFKSRGGYNTTGNRGQVLAAIYLEYCMFANLSLQVASSMPVVMDNVAMEFDRPVPVAIR
jgi:hypothetical protein